MVADEALDFRLLFEASPDVLVVLLPDAPRYTMVAATEARLAATHLTRGETIGHGIFEIFPDNPDDVTADGMRNLRASLDRVLATRTADTMAVQKYDIRGPDGSFQVHYWSPKNIPVLGADGSVRYILHRVEDVTELVRAGESAEALRDRTRAMEREVVARSRELAAANVELRDANVKLGELDAAKTAFFSNVSHEFRTPLTLMLGPLEEALADTAGLPPDLVLRLTLAHSNALRLLKLVNALLEFSRLAAGRLQASFAPVDLAALTSELAGMFESAITKAGLRLAIDCPPLAAPVWVDRDLWERVVANLVSNAFKFTMVGGITVRLRDEGERIELAVADTGAGIPAGELPRIFERFHRVASTAGRTYEGTGIGLALVREVVELHGGEVAVASTVGQGTTFVVRLQKGCAHLPSSAVTQETAAPHAASTAASYSASTAVLDVAEAARWAATTAVADPGVDPTAAATAEPAAVVAPAGRAAVLVVDDNADLRTYITGLLAPFYEVATAGDGVAALAAIRTRPPDIVVSDVMMPRLDGVGLVRELRSDPATASLPVILLSARAGEESTIVGLDAGSDDYLAKPFSARELLARVRTHVELARARRAWATELERANRELDAFSASVSHDLRAPLRAIEGFSRILAEDYGAVLDTLGNGYVDRIGANVQRMGSLIDDLLKLARIVRATLDTCPVDLAAMAARIVDDLRRAHPERTVTVEIADGLVARADPRYLDIVLVNLLGNAWKYTARTAAPHVTVGRCADDPPTFFVRDNGAGFDMAYSSQLFQPFHRLHGPDEFEGTGIGLATAERVIARHGGRIWAEAAVERGATFFFTLPS